ncbi:MAG TPA: MarR family transcriptional regulator [Patescibacteria group bacterium]|nr:MarR family transcriptional regulator [Patescibacteria group bacterium]
MQQEVLNARDIFANFAIIRRLLISRAHARGSIGDLPASQGELLLIVGNLQSATAKALACEMQLSPSAITQLVETLERLGYVQRRPSPEDRRVVRVSLTAAGQDKIASLRQQIGDFKKQITQRLSEQEIATLTAIQQKIIDFLNEPQPATTASKQMTRGGLRG